jgi:hypothetical protein
MAAFISPPKRESTAWEKISLQVSTTALKEEPVDANAPWLHPGGSGGNSGPPGETASSA